MSQNDFTIANQTFPNTRADINSALQALASTSSGSSAPSTTFANQFFYNTSSNLLQIRNEDNDAFITIAELDQTNDNVEYLKADAIRLLKVEYLNGTDAIVVNSDGSIICPQGIDLTATELILDADNDTSITANTDDQVDFKVGGTDRAYITANTIGGIVNRQNAKPLIINGDMQVAQRGTSTTGITGGGYHTIDRMKVDLSDNGTWTHTQDTDVPTGQGFANSWKLDCTTADTSVASGTFHLARYLFEGQDLQLLKKGTSSAEKVTISFWIKATVTGTYIAELFDVDNSRQISQAYTVSSANTWEKKVLSFVADTTGALGNDNASSFAVNLWLGAGSDFTSGTLSTTWTSSTNANRAVGQVNSASSTSNNVYFTGLQMEVGEYNATTIPPFQHESYGDNVSRCERYCQSSYSQGTAIGSAATAGVIIYNAAGTGIGQAAHGFPLRTVMRAVPTIVIVKSGATDTGVGKDGNTGGDIPLSAGAGSTSAMHVENSATVSNATQIQFQFHAQAEL